jgi:hypothetical protein
MRNMQHAKTTCRYTMHYATCNSRRLRRLSLLAEQRRMVAAATQELAAEAADAHVATVLKTPVCSLMTVAVFTGKRGACRSIFRETVPLSSACCMLHAACCPLVVACCTLHVARCMLHAAFYMLHAACCTLHVAFCMLHATFCMLHAASCTLQVARCVLHDTSLRAVPSADDDRAALLRLLQALPPTATERRTCRSRVVPARGPARSRLHLAVTRLRRFV